VALILSRVRAGSVTPRPYGGPVDHYAEAFCLLSERCFRLIQAENGTGHAQHCPYLTVWRGRFQDGAGKWHAVEACDGHRADLESVQRVGSPAPLRAELPWMA
jgi:hypothetical protein